MTISKTASPPRMVATPKLNPPEAQGGTGSTIGRATSILGGFYLVMAGINIGLSIGDPQSYGGFDDNALFSWVGNAWESVFMAAPDLWAKVLGAGEIALGVLLLMRGRWARAGYVGVISFHAGLLFFGWWAWLWAVPALAVLVPLSVNHWKQTATADGSVR